MALALAFAWSSGLAGVPPQQWLTQTTAAPLGTSDSGTPWPSSNSGSLIDRPAERRGKTGYDGVIRGKVRQDKAQRFSRLNGLRRHQEKTGERRPRQRQQVKSSQDQGFAPTAASEKLSWARIHGVVFVEASSEPHERPNPNPSPNPFPPKSPPLSCRGYCGHAHKKKIKANAPTRQRASEPNKRDRHSCFL